MARDGLSALRRAGLLLGALVFSLCAQVPVRSSPPEEREAIATTLAVQTALQHGRELVTRGNFETAVHVLERELSCINGNRDYLAVLRDAYRGYVKELRKAHKDSEADIYYRRLVILDPGAALDGVNNKGAAPAPMTPSTQPTEQAKTGPVARGKLDDKADDPFRAENSRDHKDARAALEKAEQEFAASHYEAAGKLFEQASQLDKRALNDDARTRWGYCKMFAVVHQLNHSGASGAAAADLEREVRFAMALAPAKFDNYGQGLLRRIQERRDGTTAKESGGSEEPAYVAVRHLERSRGWSVAETTNFRVYHNQPRDLAERTARVAEKTRADMFRKWFGETGDAWTPKCDLYIHRSADDYAQQTGAPANSPGHSTFQSDSGRVVIRRIDLHADDTNMLIAVLPHETTHVVLAGKFGDQPPPRWADEGMAVLTEPREKIDRHLRMLPHHSRERQLFWLRELMEQTYPQPQQNQYPEARRIGAFYAQSVSLVEFLSQQKGPREFTQFLRDGLRGGYETALKKHYDIKDFSELEKRWRSHAFKNSSGELAERTR
jgi:hypothetical protein